MTTQTQNIISHQRSLVLSGGSVSDLNLRKFAKQHWSKTIILHIKIANNLYNIKTKIFVPILIRTDGSVLGWSIKETLAPYIIIRTVSVLKGQ